MGRADARDAQQVTPTVINVILCKIWDIKKFTIRPDAPNEVRLRG
jgi:hypothetical protein